MYRILIAECRQEVSTFNPVPSQYSDFTTEHGQAIIDKVEGTLHELVGALEVFRSRPDIELVPGFSARSRTSGGLLSAESFARIAKEFLGSVQENYDVDGIYFVLHGAMAVDGEDDPEGYLLAETRKIVGEDIPIVASFDLHGIITDRILEHCDAISIYHTYPHVDYEDTGARAANLLLGLLDQQIKPITVRVRIPALVRGNELVTETGLFGGMIRAAQAASAQAPGLAGGMFIGNPFTDVSDLCSNVIITSDNDVEYASEQALAIAHEFWQVREQLQQPLISIEEAVQRTKQNTQGTVVLVDAADATSSGASGDSNALLRALLAADYQGRLLTTVVDEPAVQAAFEGGVGSLIHTTLGGQLDPLRFTPLPVEAKVHMLSEGLFINESWGSYWDSGLTAVLHVGRHVVVVTSKPVHLFDRSLYLAHGQNPQNFDAVVVKSPHCQPQFYADWAAQMLNVDAPGSTSANLPYLGHTACQRPIFPLDADVEFVPEVRVFQRSRFH
jgi:microcystin degradation protein MlrC